ncbi:MAG: hypothetical protein ACOX5J_15430 [Candidatus Hydrogenedentales bacterium]|jgi:hypothetical protein
MASQHTINAGFFAACLFLALGWGGAGCEAPDSGVTDAAATLEPSKMDGALLEMPSQEELADIIEAFYRSALGREVTHVEAVSEPEKNERIPFPEQYFRVREESSGRVSTVQLYLPSGTIASYGLEEPFFEDMEHEELITKAEAFEAAKPILKWYDQPLNISDYYIAKTGWSVHSDIGASADKRVMRVSLSVPDGATSLFTTGPPKLPGCLCIPRLSRPKGARFPSRKPQRCKRPWPGLGRSKILRSKVYVTNSTPTSTVWRESLRPFLIFPSTMSNSRKKRIFVR